MNVLPAIDTEAFRVDEPVFCAIDRFTVAGPVPLEALVTEIHPTGDEAVHEHSALVRMPTDTPEAPGPTDTPLLESIVLQVLPACEIVKLLPPATMVPVRAKDAPFGATVYCSVPSPLPDPPDVMVIHGALVVAVHAQPAELDTSTKPDDPAALIAIDVGVML
jgi:hypothetical protein